LRDGRKLAFREYGQGFPVVFLHGNLNSRLFAPSWGKTEEETAAAGCCRVIAVDRPGYGDSCFQPGRQHADAARDVGE
jgi:pimeloyl-ACP methyl ester carboxylesterase